MDTLDALFKEWSIGGICFRLLMATVAGVIIGMDREYKNKGAGVKTHALVSIGAAMAMILNEYVLRNYPASNTDLTRLGAQVISGIGFLGVGTIIVTGRNEVKGLTTAAGLWACAIIGLSAGIGFFEGTIIAQIFVIFVLRVLEPVDKHLRTQAKDFDLYVEFSDVQSITAFLMDVRKKGVEITNFNVFKEKHGAAALAATMTMKVPHHGEKGKYISYLQTVEGISYVHEI